MIGYLAFAASVAVRSDAPAPTGLWQNPAHTIIVQTLDCGSTLCGKIVGAAPKAVADAREAGIERLLGISLLRDYRRTGPDSWHGLVFVPDMGRTFDSRVTILSADQLRISGCIMMGLLCKSQIWTRL